MTITTNDGDNRTPSPVVYGAGTAMGTRCSQMRDRARGRMGGRAKRRRTATANDSEVREWLVVAAPAFVHLVDSPQSTIRTADPYAT